MSVLAIILIVLAALIVVFLIGGYIAARRRTEARSSRLVRELAEANEALARARAEDRGWDRDTIDAAARAAHLGRRPDADIRAVHLVQVVDDTGEHEVHLGRREGVWVPAA